MIAVSEQYIREVKLRRERVTSFDRYPIVAKRFLNEPEGQLDRLLA